MLASVTDASIAATSSLASLAAVSSLASLAAVSRHVSVWGAGSPREEIRW
jgi:hypothetical protein